MALDHVSSRDPGLPPWNDPEGRLSEVEIKDIHAGESYTDEEVKRLRDWWTEERTAAVARWIENGTPKGAIPEFVPTREYAFPGMPTFVVCDLRGIDLSRHLGQARTADSPPPSLFGTHLEYANLTATHLEYAKLWYVRLQHARLWWTHLEHAELWNSEIWMADFSGAFLREATFNNVRWRSDKGKPPPAVLFSGFSYREIRCNDPLFERFVRQSAFIMSCRETWWNPWRFLARFLWPLRRENTEFLYAMGGKYLPSTRLGKLAVAMNKWPPPLWLLWKVTCNCGRSFWRWVVACTLIALLFGFVFYAFATWGSAVVQLEDPEWIEREPNLFTYFYFSIVTFTTLGFGDVTPTRLLGEILVTIEVILGYVGLGGLISIFTTKLIPPR